MFECSISKTTQDGNIVIGHCDIRENMIMTPEAVFNELTLEDVDLFKSNSKCKKYLVLSRKKSNNYHSSETWEVHYE